jgi:hypothetical protein
MAILRRNEYPDDFDFSKIINSFPMGETIILSGGTFDICSPINLYKCQLGLLDHNTSIRINCVRQVAKPSIKAYGINFEI